MNSKNWNRVITGAAAVSLTIGMMAPMAFAATAATQYNTRTINVGSGYTAVVNGIVAKDVSTMTEFLPVYYMMQGLGKLGYTVNWNGGTCVLNITTPAGVTVNAPSATVGTPAANQMVIQLNGTNVQLAPRVVAKDPASGVMTTFAPIYYLNQALKLAGFTNTYNGQSWTLTGQAASQTGTGLSAITVSNESNGTGAVASPAISLNNTAIALSTTLKDANGNPLPNTAVTFNVSNYGSYPTGYLPTVQNTSGTVISGQQQTNAEQYTVYTDANGVAKISMTGPSGSTYAYEVVATAPYAGTTGSAISSQAAYLEFVANNQAGLSPYAGSSAPYSAAMGQPMPVTLTLPPNASGQPQANVLVTLSVAAVTGTNYSSFVSANGAVLGPVIQVTTNSAGVAQAYLSDANQQTVKVSAAGLPAGVNIPNATYINFAQTGVPSKINNLSVSSNTPSIGQNVYVSGQLQDASGNPVANGQILVTSPNDGSGDIAYVNGTTTTTFPLVGSETSNNWASAGLVVGTPATSSYGDLVTSDSAGNFSFTLTDPRVETQEFYMYPVANGEVNSATPLNGTTSSNNNSITFGTSTSLATLSVGAFGTYVQNNSATTLTGLSANINGGMPLGSSLGANYIANVYAEPQSSAGHHTGGVLDNTANTYSLTLNNGGLIYSINGTVLTTPAAAVTLSYDGNGGFTANGQTVGNLIAKGSAHQSDFVVGATNANSGSTTLTISSGTVSSTAAINFVGGTPAQAANFSPGSVIVTGGQQQQVTFQVQDAAGNPVANTATNVMTDQAATDGFFITQVNGVTLQESVNMGSSTNASYTTEATPIPLGSVPSSLDYSIGIPGVAAWTNGSNYFTVYSDASGNVTLTLQAGGLNYPTAVTSSVYTPNTNNYAPSTSGSGWLGFYSNGSGDSHVPLYVVTSSGAPTSSFAGTITPTGGSADSFSGSLLGQINW